MAASYVAATVVTVALVEAVVLGLVLPRLLRGPSLETKLRQQVSADAGLLASPRVRRAARSSQVAAWKVLTTEVHQAAGAVWLPASRASDLALTVVSTDAADASRLALPVEVLVDTHGVIRASSAPRAYRPNHRLVTPRGEQPVARGSYSTAAGGSYSTAAGDVTWARAPLQVAGRVLGAVYIQAPSSAGASPQVSRPLLLTAGGMLAVLFVPAGVVFGLFSTRSLIRRIRRLADSTSAVAGGDFQRRIEQSGQDEIGQLEGAFNAMAAQLDESMARERSRAGASARQAERSRIARELHDSISQDLFSLTLLAAGMRKGQPSADRLTREAEVLERTAARTMRDMQALLLELRPVVLEDSGLSRALAGICAAYTERLGVRVQADIAEVRMDPQAEHAVLRLTQEALANAVKHAGAELIAVRLAQDGAKVTVEISDDGRGFDPEAVAEGHGMGLRFMRDRVEELGGTFRLVSTSGGGTVVLAFVPAATAPSDASP